MSKWISVKDRLPLFDTEVITYESDGYFRIGYLAKLENREMEIAWFNDQGLEYIPSHWMLLPKSPR